MGFFKDMGLIGNVYKHLRAINAVISSDGCVLWQEDASLVREHLTELIRISNMRNRTIDYAHFDFMGEKLSLDEIIFIVDSFLRSRGY